MQENISEIIKRGLMDGVAEAGVDANIFHYEGNATAGQTFFQVPLLYIRTAAGVNGHATIALTSLVTNEVVREFNIKLKDIKVGDNCIWQIRGSDTAAQYPSLPCSVVQLDADLAEGALRYDAQNDKLFIGIKGWDTNQTQLYIPYKLEIDLSGNVGSDRIWCQCGLGGRLVVSGNGHVESTMLQSTIAQMTIY